MPDARFAALAAEYLRRMYDYSPQLARSLGLHEYDGRMADPSASARSARVSELRDLRRRLSQVQDQDLDEQERFDRDLIGANLEHELYQLEGLRAHEWSPLVHVYPADVSDYVKREYAPLPDRVRSMTEQLRAVPEYLAEGWRSLRPDLPRDPLEIAISAFDGQAAYLRGDIREAALEVPDRALLSEFESACAAAAAALEGFADRLRERLPAAHGEFAIGRESYESMLRTGELLDLPLERVLEVGEANLRANEELLGETAERINPGRSMEETMRALGREHPPADRLVPETAELLEDIRAFLIERDIVGVPSEVRCIVRETPPSMRWAFAMMDSAGPFEATATESYYYVTPVEPDWSPEQQEEWLSRFDYHTLRDVSVHEAYPGHYLHFLHMKRAPSDVSKVLTSYAFVEGWAHYAEQMMVESGFRDFDPKLRLAQLKEALLRNCRYIVSIGMHTQGMSVDDATRFLMEHGYMEELPARKEAQRGAFDPGYLNYTLGKLMLLKLREEYELERGMDFSLREFHDRVLACGAPPIPLLRKQLLSEPGVAL
jgi:uncharacterized protein (DUF885 family)